MNEIQSLIQLRFVESYVWLFVILPWRFSSHQLQTGHSQSEYLVTLLNWRTFPHKTMSDLLHLAGTDKAILTFENFLVCRNAPFYKIIIKKLPLSPMAAYKFGLYVSVSILFAKKKDESWTNWKNDLLYFCLRKRFVFESIDKQVIIGFVLNNDFLIVLAKKILRRTVIDQQTLDCAEIRVLKADPLMNYLIQSLVLFRGHLYADPEAIRLPLSNRSLLFYRCPHLDLYNLSLK